MVALYHPVKLLLLCLLYTLPLLVSSKSKLTPGGWAPFLERRSPQAILDSNTTDPQLAARVDAILSETPLIGATSLHLFLSIQPRSYDLTVQLHRRSSRPSYLDPLDLFRPDLRTQLHGPIREWWSARTNRPTTSAKGPSRRSLLERLCTMS